VNLLQSLQDEIDKMLGQEQIYEALDYAWEDENTPSDLYIGLAMWLQDAPFQLDEKLRHRKSPPPNPSARDEFFLKSGEDFIGTMNLSRRALGVGLYSQTNYDPKNLSDDEDHFWEYRAIAAQWLNIASDRIRDYFVMARFLISYEDFKKLDDKNRSYNRAFTVPEPRGGPRATAVLEKLKPAAVEIRAFRQMRNSIVHEVASRQGSNALRFLQNQRKEAQQTPFIPRPRDAMLGIGSFADMGKRFNDERLKERGEALSQLKTWYLTLVKAGSMVFEFEYWNRNGR
jgi:hypothetical protein